MSSTAARRALRWTSAAAAAALPVAAGVTWAGARVLTDTPSPRVRVPTMDARFLDDQLVELRGNRANDSGSWGLALDNAFVRIGSPIGQLDEWVQRPYTLLDGAVPLAAQQLDRRIGARRRADDTSSTSDAGGRWRRLRRDRRRTTEPPPWPQRATITPFAWPDDPQVLARCTGSSFRVDGVRSGGHVLPVWILEPPNANDTWVVGVHGRGSPRTELFRIAEVALGLGHPVLLASYRTDAWTSAPAPTTTLGTLEWRDAEANVAAALSAGARQVVLAGCSLGGGLVAQVMRRSELAPWVAGVVLDSPALAWAPLLRYVARRRRLPAVMVGPVMAAARLRSAVDWSALDHLAAGAEFSQPVLVLHGLQDDVVPSWMSEAFATARPDLVTLELFEHADHVTSWNHAPLRYERAVRRFLARIVA
ncbi:MAG: acetyl esterase/lipase [Nitriliruptoraceae bacterium]|jgi:acetyl esterase/lipase